MYKWNLKESQEVMGSFIPAILTGGPCVCSMTSCQEMKGSGKKSHPYASEDTFSGKYSRHLGSLPFG